MTKLVTFGVLCAIAMIIACFSRDERDTVKVAGVVLFGNWLLFAMPWIYAPISPAFLASYVGIDMNPEDFWAITDMASMAYIGWRSRYIWWGPVLWTWYFVPLGMYAVAWGGEMQYTEYAVILDATLIMQIAVLLCLGGGGCADYLSSRWGRVRGVVRPAGGLPEPLP